MISDLRFALRQLWKSPGFTAVAVLTLALGIGACTAIFSLVDTVLLRPLPYPESDRLMVVQQQFKGSQDIPFSWPNFEDVARDNHSFAALTIVQRGDYTLSGNGAAEKVRGALVSSDFFQVFGVQPVLGRPFTKEEDRIGVGKVAVIRASLWQRRFGGTPDVLGQTAVFDGDAYTIVGVLPNDMITPSNAEFWLPITPFSNSPGWQKRGNQPGFFGYGRLKTGVTVEQARADLRAIGQRLQQQYPAECAETLPMVAPLLEAMVKGYRDALWMLMGAVGLLLAIACANVGSLALARTLSRAQEFAVRAALGSTRGRLLRQVLVENLLLFVIGGGLGVLLAYWSLDSIRAFSPPTVRFQNLSVNLSVLLFSVGATLATGLFFGLWPALRAARTDLLQVLQGAGRGAVGSSSQWTRQIMVAGQVALTVLLVAGAGLFARSLARIQDFSFGFDARNLLVFTVSVPDTGGAYEKPESRVAFFEVVKTRLAALPGVRSVGFNYSLPLRTQWSTYFDVAGRAPYAPGHEPAMEMGVIDPDYFSTLGLPIVRGRNFKSADQAGTRAKLIIDERMAKAIWPGEDPIGKILFRGRAANRNAEEQQGTEVIGVVPSLALYGIDDVQADYFQGYLAQTQEAFNEMNFVVRTGVAPLSLEKSVRDAVAAVDPNVPVYAINTMEKMIAANHATQALYSRLVGFFAVVALLLACLGLHGVVAHAMTTRRRELGIRMALGASARQVVSLVLRQGVVPLLIGLGAGIFGAVALGRLIAGLLYQVSPNDPFTLLATIALLLGVALLTLWRPALRITKINPMVALREE
ncbi:MAG TPA: ABC transporter permease [Chthoniobacterales bacterium]|nr:ABC transporter permease [Chthoniobacterales bacterium]